MYNYENPRNCDCVPKSTLHDVHAAAVFRCFISWTNKPYTTPCTNTSTVYRNISLTELCCCCLAIAIAATVIAIVAIAVAATVVIVTATVVIAAAVIVTAAAIITTTATSNSHSNHKVIAIVIITSILSIR